MNTIQPIQPIGSLEELGKLKQTQAAGPDSSVALPFQSLVRDAVSGVQQTGADLDGEIYKLTTGQSDDLHNMMIASQKAGLSVSMVVELRNKLLDAYKEIMNTSL